MSKTIVVAYDKEDDSFICGWGDDELEARENLKDWIWKDAVNLSKMADYTGDVLDICQAWTIVSIFSINMALKVPKRDKDFEVDDLTS